MEKIIPDVPYNKEYNLTHYTQRYNWDCGLSCIIMILSTACGTTACGFLENFDKIRQEEGYGDSTWTIDLCYVLKRFNISHVYYTKTIGVDPSYSHHSYYTKIIDMDEKRVNAKFKNAAANGITVKKMTVNFDVIIKHLAFKGPVIVLTDASLLGCDICKKDKPRNVPGYAGHYVVLSGYDLFRKKVLYHNPDVRDGHICISSIESMDKARTAHGTDEDVIFIFKKGF